MIRYILLLCAVGFISRLHGIEYEATNEVSFPSQRGDKASAETVNANYPRPIMARSDWLNLNDIWDCGFTYRDRTNIGTFSSKILIPFPVESKLSSVGRLFTEKQRLWYRHSFNVPERWQNQRVMLYFEAVDWEVKVWVNGKEMGTHQGGYDRFSFDITDTLRPEGQQELIVSVFDPTETGYQPRGKQMLHPKEPFFHTSSGIWQAVWLESVPATSVESLKLVPDIDAGVLKINISTHGDPNGITVQALVLSEGREVGHATGNVDAEFNLPVPNAKLWSPNSPFLYDLKVSLLRNGQKVGEVSSYFGMRKISVSKDESGFPRLLLNNKFLFQLGVLDQGYWPDGIYTAPSDDALRYDVEMIKKLGFNMCRMHVKIEADRWYYWCDKLGVLVWQDMPNGDRAASNREKEIQRRPESAQQFEQELKQMILQRGNHPCIVMWVPFNQGWGQYDTARITDMIKQLDPSRPVISASGWHDMGTGDVRSLHHYQEPARPVHDGKRACVLGEFGGLGLVVPGHLWGGIGRWNTAYFPTAEAMTVAYGDLLSQVETFKEKNGLSGAVFTQLTDVETELNGLMTYDRAVIKMAVDTIRKINERVIGASAAAVAK